MVLFLLLLNIIAYLTCHLPLTRLLSSIDALTRTITDYDEPEKMGEGRQEKGVKFRPKTVPVNLANRLQTEIISLTHSDQTMLNCMLS